VVTGQQLFWVRPRVTYKNTAGTALGRYDISHKSPNIYAETTAP